MLNKYIRHFKKSRTINFYSKTKLLQLEAKLTYFNLNKLKYKKIYFIVKTVTALLWT